MSIPSFIETYSIQTEELLEPDISKYKNFNEFFSRYPWTLIYPLSRLIALILCRKLRPDARPIQNEHDERVLISAADCRLTVFESIDTAKAFW